MVCPYFFLFLFIFFYIVNVCVCVLIQKLGHTNSQKKKTASLQAECWQRRRPPRLIAVCFRYKFDAPCCSGPQQTRTRRRRRCQRIVSNNWNWNATANDQLSGSWLGVVWGGQQLLSPAFVRFVATVSSGTMCQSRILREPRYILLFFASLL